MSYQVGRVYNFCEVKTVLETLEDGSTVSRRGCNFIQFLDGAFTEGLKENPFDWEISESGSILIYNPDMDTPEVDDVMKLFYAYRGGV